MAQGLIPFPHLPFCPDTGKVSLISKVLEPEPYFCIVCFFSCPVAHAGGCARVWGCCLLPPQMGEQIWQSKYLKTTTQTKMTYLTLVINLCGKLTGKFTLTEVSAKCPSSPCPFLGLMGAQFSLFIFHFQLNMLLLNFNWNIGTCSALNIRPPKGMDQEPISLSREHVECQQILMLLSFPSGPDMLCYLREKVASQCGFVGSKTLCLPLEGS